MFTYLMVFKVFDDKEPIQKLVIGDKKVSIYRFSG